jgi:hypothetical protein
MNAAVARVVQISAGSFSRGAEGEGVKLLLTGLKVNT